LRMEILLFGGSYFPAASVGSEDGGPGRIAMSGSPSIGYPASTHASSPPASGRTSVNPRSISMRATRAAVASLGQVQ
jgi:hypothetical protein